MQIFVCKDWKELVDGRVRTFDAYVCVEGTKRDVTHTVFQSQYPYLTINKAWSKIRQYDKNDPPQAAANAYKNTVILYDRAHNLMRVSYLWQRSSIIPDSVLQRIDSGHR